VWSQPWEVVRKVRAGIAVERSRRRAGEAR